jgi:RES domain-containing protein
MEVFRLARRKFILPLNGKGAALCGARWNSPGTELIYTAENRSLAMAEVAVHFSLATLPDDYAMMSMEIPSTLKLSTLDSRQLPKGWNNFPYIPDTQKIGDTFVLENVCVGLLVPSVVTQGDFNLLLNPKHADFKKIKITKVEDFPFDRRILK